MAIGPVQGSSRATDGNGTDQTGNQPRREQSVRLGANAAQFDIEAAEPETQRGCSQWCRRFWQAVRNFFTRCGRQQTPEADIEEGLSVEALYRIDQLEKELQAELDKDKAKATKIRTDNQVWYDTARTKVEVKFADLQVKLEAQLEKAQHVLAQAQSETDKTKAEEKVRRCKFRLTENGNAKNEEMRHLDSMAASHEEELCELESSWLRSSTKQKLRKAIVWESHNRVKFTAKDVGAPMHMSKEEVAQAKTFFPELKEIPKYWYTDVPVKTSGQAQAKKTASASRSAGESSV